MNFDSLPKCRQCGRSFDPHPDEEGDWLFRGWCWKCGVNSREAIILDLAEALSKADPAAFRRIIGSHRDLIGSAIRPLAGDVPRPGN